MEKSVGSIARSGAVAAWRVLIWQTFEKDIITWKPSSRFFVTDPVRMDDAHSTESSDGPLAD